jgi:hypothetical protein
MGQYTLAASIGSEYWFQNLRKSRTEEKMHGLAEIG